MNKVFNAFALWTSMGLIVIALSIAAVAVIDKLLKKGKRK